MTSLHRYPGAALRGDYVRAAAGLVLCGGPLVLVTAHPLALWMLGSCAGLFLLFGLRTLVRQGTVYELSPEALSRKGLSTFGVAEAKVCWAELTTVKLRYYSTRRGRGQGWMQLQLKSGRQGVKIESSLDGFNRIAARAARAGAARGIDPGPATIDNFQALGIRYHPEPAAEAPPP